MGRIFQSSLKRLFMKQNVITIIKMLVSIKIWNSTIVFDNFEVKACLWFNIGRKKRCAKIKCTYNENLISLSLSHLHAHSHTNTHFHTRTKKKVNLSSNHFLFKPKDGIVSIFRSPLLLFLGHHQDSKVVVHFSSTFFLKQNKSFSGRFWFYLRINYVIY